MNPVAQDDHVLTLEHNIPFETYSLGGICRAGKRELTGNIALHKVSHRHRDKDETAIFFKLIISCSPPAYHQP